MPPTVDELSDLFCDVSASAEDLRFLLRRAFQGTERDVGGWLPEGLGKVSTCQKAAEVLGARGWIDDKLGEGLLRERGNGAHGDRIRALFPPPAPAPQPTAAAPPVRLRWWDPGPPPAGCPWPGLHHCVHPTQLGGREQELTELLGLAISGPQPIVLCYAASGVGKSSLLDAGVRARLAADNVPVALDRRPGDPGLLVRLATQLVEEPPPLADDDLDAWASLLRAVGRESRRTPVILLDQAEDLLLDRAAKGRVGSLLAQAVANPGVGLARWVLAYRNEFHGQMVNLLAEPLAFSSPPPGLPRQIRREAFVDQAILPLGRGFGAVCDMERITACFAEAALGSPGSALRAGTAAAALSPDAATRLGAAFARARAHAAEQREDLPLTPELQVVLLDLYHHTLHNPGFHHQNQPGKPRQLQVPAADPEVDALIAGALHRHLLKHLDEVISSLPIDERGDAAARAERRTAGMLLLHALTDGAGRRRRLTRRELLGDRGPLASQICKGLEESGRWIIISDRAPHEEERLSLPHDSLAQVICTLCADPQAAVHWGLSGGLLGLDRVVRARIAAAEVDPDAHHLSATQVDQIRPYTDLLIVGDRARTWWQKVCAHREAEDRTDTIRRVRTADARSGDGLRALAHLLHHHHFDGPSLLHTLRFGDPAQRDTFGEEQRDALFGEGVSALSPEEAATLLPPLVATLSPVAHTAPSPDALFGALVSLADGLPPGPLNCTLEAQVQTALRTVKREPPPFRDADWSPVVQGEFWVGRFPEERQGNDNEQLHRVVLSPYRIARVAVTTQEWWDFRHKGQAGEPQRWAPMPADSLNWYEARGYAAWRGCRLPTERQWEAACRGGGTAYGRGAHWAGGTDALGKWAVHSESRNSLGVGQCPMDAASPIPGAPPHPLGLLHIQGNMYTWTMDWYEADYSKRAQEGPEDPSTSNCPTDGTAPWRVVRGGSWVNSAALARVAGRNWYRPGDRFTAIGLRLVLPQPAGTGS